VPQYQGFKRIGFAEADSVKMVSFLKWEDLVKARRSDTLAIGKWNDNSFEGTITLQKPKLLSFSIPFDAGWSATVNGTPQKLLKVNIGLTALLLPAGSHTVSLQYSSPFLGLSAGLSVLGIILFAFLCWRRPSKNQAIDSI
jgi:uncharacterized membrane protein YfhO